MKYEIVLSFCPKCGNTIRNGDSFCGKCGAVATTRQESTFEELPRDYYVDKMEAKIEGERGRPLSLLERKLLRLPLFQSIQKNCKWFSLSQDEREKIGYPRDLKGLISYYKKQHDLTESQLKDVGLSSSDF